MTARLRRGGMWGLLALVVLALVGLTSSPRGVQAQAVDLTGLWQDDTGGGAVYRVRQVGDQVYWSVDATAVRSFANVFVGAIDGAVIAGHWVDLPGSPQLGGGALTMRIDSNDHLVKVDESSAYGAREWFRQGSGGSGTVPASGVEGRNLQVVSESDGAVTVNWRGLSGTTNDWVSIIAAGAPDTDYIGGQWTYTDRTRSGTFRVRGLPPGEYEVRLYLDWPAGGYLVAERLRFRPR